MAIRQRKFKNYLIKPRFQFQFTLYYLICGIGVFGGMVAWNYQTSLDLQTVVLSSEHMSPANQLSLINGLNSLTITALASMAFFIIISAGFSVFLTHRIAGPSVAIKKYIEDLKNGNYDSKRSLRPNDELNEIMTELHELAQNLKNKGQTT